MRVVVAEAAPEQGFPPDGIPHFAIGRGDRTGWSAKGMGDALPRALLSRSSFKANLVRMHLTLPGAEGSIA
jgi:hypothetical protein